MAETFHLSLLTPERSLLEAEVISIVAPGSQGYLGVLAHHAPLVTALQPGRLEVKFDDQKESIYAVSGGFLEVSENKATVLADAVEIPEEIDVERAERSLNRARERLRDTTGKSDVTRADASLKRALNRIKIVRSI